MLPLAVLRCANNLPVLVELKSGETYNGQLKACDGWMNVCLVDVICTARDGDRFWRMQECYIRGTNIKYLRIPDEVLQLVKEDQGSGRGGGRGGFRGRGGGGGGRGGHQRGAPGGGGNQPNRGGYNRGGRGGGGFRQDGGPSIPRGFGSHSGSGGFRRGY